MASLSPRQYSTNYTWLRNCFPLLFPIFHAAKTNKDYFLVGQLLAPITLLCASVAVQFINGVPINSRQEIILIEEAVHWLRPHGISFVDELNEDEFFDQLFNLVCDFATMFFDSLGAVPGEFGEEDILAEWETTGAPHAALEFMIPAHRHCNRLIISVVQEYVVDLAGDLSHQGDVIRSGFTRFFEVNGRNYMRFVSSECWPRKSSVNLPHQLLNQHLYDHPDRQAQEHIDDRMLRSFRRKSTPFVELLPDETPLEYRPANMPIPLLAFSSAHFLLSSPAQCGICLLDLTAMECNVGHVVSTRCGHLYHSLCLYFWVNESAMDTSNRCPTCRGILCPRRMRRHGNILVP